MRYRCDIDAIVRDLVPLENLSEFRDMDVDLKYAAIENDTGEYLYMQPNSIIGESSPLQVFLGVAFLVLIRYSDFHLNCDVFRVPGYPFITAFGIH